MSNQISLTDREARIALAGLKMHIRRLEEIRGLLPDEPEALALNTELRADHQSVVDKIEEELGLNRRYAKP